MKKIHTYGCIYRNKHRNSNIMHNEAITIVMTTDGETNLKCVRCTLHSNLLRL